MTAAVRPPWTIPDRVWRFLEGELPPSLYNAFRVVVAQLHHSPLTGWQNRHFPEQSAIVHNYRDLGFSVCRPSSGYPALQVWHRISVDFLCVNYRIVFSRRNGCISHIVAKRPSLPDRDVLVRLRRAMRRWLKRKARRIATHRILDEMYLFPLELNGLVAMYVGVY